MKKLFLSLMFFIVSGALVACSTATKPNVAPVAKADQLPLELTLVATDIAYDNNRLEVKAGQPVKLTLQNDGVLEHDFTIVQIPLTGDAMATELGAEEAAGHDMSDMEAEADVHVAALMDISNTVSFTPLQSGEYEFYCTVAGHKEAGMIGTLAVAAP